MSGGPTDSLEARQTRKAFDDEVHERALWRVPDETALTTDRFSIRLWAPAPTVLCSWATGHLTIEAVTPMVERFELQAHVVSAPARIEVFHDFSGVTGYDSAARVHFTESSKKMMHRAGTITYLTTSTLMTMAVSVANVIFGNLRATTDRAAFDAELNAAVAASGRSRHW